MAPDINTLPPSRSSSGSPSQPRAAPVPNEALRRDTPSPSPRSSSISLAAAAAMNAQIQNQESRRSSTSSAPRSRTGTATIPPPTATSSTSPITSARQERRRSTVLMSLNLNDPATPGPGEMQADGGASGHRHSIFRAASPHALASSPSTADPHHQRAPSLGELHQELEAEQEAQVNRLLQMIRQQQLQLQALQQPSGQTAVEDSTPTSERSLSFPTAPANPTTIINPRPRSPAPPGQARSSFDLSRQSSRRSRNSSRDHHSPSTRPMSIPPPDHSDQPWALGGNRDESAFYQAETQMLTRENQMLKLRIRELERQVHELNSTSATSPAVASQLASPPIQQEGISPSLTDEEKSKEETQT